MKGFGKGSGLRIVCVLVLGLGWMYWFFRREHIPVFGGPSVTVAHVGQWNYRAFGVIQREGISYEAMNGLGVSTLTVPKEDAAQTIELLVADAISHHYWLEIAKDGKWDTYNAGSRSTEPTSPPKRVFDY